MAKDKKSEDDALLIRTVQWKVAHVERFGDRVELGVSNGYNQRAATAELSIEEAKALVKQIKRVIKDAETYKESW